MLVSYCMTKNINVNKMLKYAKFASAKFQIGTRGRSLCRTFRLKQNHSAAVSGVDKCPGKAIVLSAENVGDQAGACDRQP